MSPDVLDDGWRDRRSRQARGRVDLVVTDLDGTLWDVTEQIHAGTLSALAALRERGTPVLAATGRRLRSARAGLAVAGLDLPVVALDGAVGRSGGHATSRDGRFQHAPFAREDAITTLEAFRAAGLSPCVYVDNGPIDAVVGPRPSTHARHLAHLSDGLRSGDLRAVVAAEHVLAFALVGASGSVLDEVAAMVEHTGSGSARRYDYLDHEIISVRARGINKWDGVLAYCAHAGLDPSSVLAIGDGENDLELLASAATSCVVADGHPDALALADHVINPPAAGGWSAVLQHV